ncbi:MAG: tetratricopeptide repeat protein [Rhodoferax sp.]|nr:tetratricopeptide repeat protein [Rhodoferax sp.]
MANQLDLEEQEQLDELKHFWKQYGNLITWVLIAALGTFAAWNGYQYWQRSQSVQAAALYDELERVVATGDVAKSERAFTEMKDRFASTLYAQQAGLLVAKLAFGAGKPEIAQAALRWVAEQAADKGYVSVAKLRLASVLIEAKSYDDALKVLADGVTEEFQAMAADRRGDIYALQGKTAEAKAEYEKAFKSMDEQSDYRRLVDVKLAALGAKAGASAPRASEGSK